jgi:hypothetical protein
MTGVLVMGPVFLVNVLGLMASVLAMSPKAVFLAGAPGRPPS